jgi:hypothetical protein
MPPKRPRIVPSQTNLSVQDVRDYSTPDGAAMANEEMRRLKLAIQAVAEEQAAAVGAQQAAVAPAPGADTDSDKKPEVTELEYTWTVKAQNYVGAVVENEDVVVFRGVNGINVSQVGKTITIAQNVLSWIIRADIGTHNVRNEGIVRVKGVNGVKTRVYPGNPLGTLEIDRPLSVYQRSIQIGDAGTIGLNFHNHSNFINKHEHDQIHFKVEDEGNGIRRITGWYKSGVTTTSSLEGALSTVWIKDANGDPAVGFGYDTGSGTYLQQLYIGPWGWHTNNAPVPPDPTPYLNSNFSNNAKDTQWDWGMPIRANALQAYSRFGKVSKAGLYLISGTTQGYRWVSNDCVTNMTPWINTRIHYYLVVNRPLGDVPNIRIYKTLDVEPWDFWAPGLLDTVEARANFVNQMSSRPWGVQGTAQIWLNVGDEVMHYITYNTGTGESKVGYQVTYHAFEGICVADETTLDPATQVNLVPINYPDPYQSYHQMQFINV